MSSTEIYATYINDCVKAEVEHRRSLEQRAGALITVSGALTSALFALLTIVGAKGHPFLSSGLKAVLYVVVATFAASAVFAIGAAAPLRAGQLDVVSARAKFREQSAESADSARAKVLSTRLEELGDLERMNAMKAKLLLGGICAQAVAVTCLSAAVIVHLNG